MSKEDDTTQQPKETDKQSEIEKAADRPKVDVIEAMQEGVTLAKGEGIKNLRFTVGGTGQSKFSIEGLTEEERNDESEATPDRAAGDAGPGSDRQSTRTGADHTTPVNFPTVDVTTLRVLPAMRSSSTRPSPG